jgi:5,6-dimethylbenzimidazole synthase
VRWFRRDPLPAGTVERLIATAALAPSVGNAQPWRFQRVNGQGEALAAEVDRASAAAAERYPPERAAAYRALKLHGLREAPERLAVWSDDAPAAGHGLGVATMPEMLRYSTVMAVHTLWLAARAEGIGLGWVSILDPDAVRTLLAAPAHWTLIALLCLGYPEEEARIPELERRGWQAREAVRVEQR